MKLCGPPTNLCVQRTIFSGEKMFLYVRESRRWKETCIPLSSPYLSFLNLTHPVGTAWDDASTLAARPLE